MDTGWQKNWKCFVDLLTEQLRRGATNEELAALFGSESVTWTGVLTEKQLDDDAPTVAVTFPTEEIDLGQSGVFEFGDQLAPVTEDSMSQWKSIQSEQAYRSLPILVRQDRCFRLWK